jgi:hypothetical protein
MKDNYVEARGLHCMEAKTARTYSYLGVVGLPEGKGTARLEVRNAEGAAAAVEDALWEVLLGDRDCLHRIPRILI